MPNERGSLPCADDQQGDVLDGEVGKVEAGSRSAVSAHVAISGTGGAWLRLGLVWHQCVPAVGEIVGG